MSGDGRDLKVVNRPIKSIRPYPGNPRVNADTVAEVVKSIQEFGWRQPIVVDEQGVIIVGHTRYLAAKKLRQQTVPVHVARGLTPEQARAYRIADNKIPERSTWDYPKLEAELQALAGADMDLALTGFTQEEAATVALQAAEARRQALADFNPATAEEQGRLDQKTPVQCPKCGHTFSP